jgi:2-polyprenyl-3-methyl-5-hydroxy-6-metoxy-1,4-benzoquinol methylase
VPMKPSELSHRARELYRKGSGLKRLMQRSRPWICPFDRLLPLVPAGATVLDVGCGGGLFLFLLASYDGRATGTGIDLSPSSILFARENLDLSASLRERISFHVLNAASHWPFGQFGVVTMIDLLHHVPAERQLEVLAEAASHVKPGGILLYKDMCDSPWWLAAANRFHDLAVAREWIHYLPSEAAELWASAAGMKMVHTEDVRRGWYGHELRVFVRPGNSEPS